MSYSALSKRARNPYETLERMLNKTTLTTQRIAHSNIVELGAHMVSTKAGDFQEEHECELQQAVDEAEERATRELKAALKRLKENKDEEKNKALQNQKEYYEKLSRQVEEQRNHDEGERKREIIKKLLHEKEEALNHQLQDCEKGKEEAVAAACEELTKRMRQEFILEREYAVAETLKVAKEKYLVQERNMIEKTRQECEELAKLEAKRVAKLHKQDIETCNHRYELLEKKFLQEVEHRKNVEQDFRELQDDYRRFMDYTDGMFHSDYLMQLRHIGQKLSNKRLSTVNYKETDAKVDGYDSVLQDFA